MLHKFLLDERCLRMLSLTISISIKCHFKVYDLTIYGQ